MVVAAGLHSKFINESVKKQLCQVQPLQNLSWYVYKAYEILKILANCFFALMMLFFCINWSLFKFYENSKKMLYYG